MTAYLVPQMQYLENPANPPPARRLPVHLIWLLASLPIRRLIVSMFAQCPLPRSLRKSKTSYNQRFPKWSIRFAVL